MAWWPSEFLSQLQGFLFDPKPVLLFMQSFAREVFFCICKDFLLVLSFLIPRKHILVGYD